MQWVVLGVDVTNKLTLVKRCDTEVEAEQVARLQQSPVYRNKFVIEGTFYPEDADVGAGDGMYYRAEVVGERSQN